MGHAATARLDDARGPHALNVLGSGGRPQLGLDWSALRQHGGHVLPMLTSRHGIVFDTPRGLKPHGFSG